MVAAIAHAVAHASQLVAHAAHMLALILPSGDPPPPLG